MQLIAHYFRIQSQPLSETLIHERVTESVVGDWYCGFCFSFSSIRFEKKIENSICCAVFHTRRKQVENIFNADFTISLYGRFLTHVRICSWERLHHKFCDNCIQCWSWRYIVLRWMIWQWCPVGYMVAGTAHLFLPDFYLTWVHPLTFLIFEKF